MSKAKDYMLGLLSGAVLGSIFGLLFAPDKGSNTRDIVSYRLSNYIDEVSRLIDELTHEKKIASDAKKKGDLVVEDARHRAENLIKEAEEILGEIESSQESQG